jgi:hypothetical protein
MKKVRSDFINRVIQMAILTNVATIFLSLPLIANAAKINTYAESISIGGMSLVLDEYYEAIETEDYVDLEVPKNNSFKSYMSYKAITNKSSKQYGLQRYAYTDCLGLRCVDGRICIAVGTYYTNTIGTKLDVVMKNGAVIECIVGDIKANVDTDKLNRQHLADKSVIEFIVDPKEMPSLAKKTGDISYAHEDFKGEVSYIRKYINEEIE